MTAFYWDTSALLALLFEEPQGDDLRRLALKKGALPGYTSFFSFIEMESAYSRRLSEGALNNSQLPELRLKAQKLESSLGVIWSDEETLRDARHLVLEQGLRPGDALQLASARLLLQDGSQATFVCLDKKLNQAAQAVGLASAY
ncbi:MAG: type II toxin-antitoxin system VapC family toxin [Elusimicrobiota bacterium]